MEMGLIFGIVLVLLILTFGTLTIIFSLKTWHWLHITAFCLLLVTLAPAMYYLAAYARTMAAWGDVYNKTADRLAKAELEKQKLNVGDPPLQPNPASPGRIQAVAALDRLVAQRGRVWRNCTATPFAPAAGGGFVSKVTTLPPGTEPANVSKSKNGVVPQTEVFLFRQIPGANPQEIAGLSYLGRFGVVAATESDIDIAPHDYVDPQQLAAFGPGNLLTVYETLPTDDNSVFADVAEAERAAAIDRAFAPFAPGGPAATALTPEAFQALVDSFKRTGGAKLDTDRPEEVWTKVKLLEDYTENVDAEAVSGVDTQLFDSSGRAIRGALRRGEPVKFKKGEEISLSSVAAEELIRQGKAEKVSDEYRREERDFDTGFRLLSKQATDINAEMQKVQRNITAMQETLKKLESENAYREKEKAALTSDLKNFENDATVMMRLAGEMKDAHSKLLDRLSTIYRANQDMLAKIAEVDAKLTEQIDRASQTAAAK